MKEKTELPAFLLDHTPWEEGVNPIWPASSFVLHRNLGKRLFPPKMSDAQLRQILDVLKDALLKSTHLNRPLLLIAEEVSPLDREYLIEHYLRLEGFPDTTSGQAFIIDESRQFLGLINIQDHLQIQLLDCKGDWEKTWNALSKLETSLASNFDYAFSPRFGYLTSEPGQCGTGLIVQAFLHLPALIHTGQLSEALVKQKDENVDAEGMQGTLDELIGDIIVLENKYTLGLSEESILHALNSTAMKLIVSEKALRAHLKEKNNPDMKDQVSRSYGLLLHSYQLETKEALNALSLIKLGIDLGWVAGITDQKLNTIFFKCRRAHLSHVFEGKAYDAQELSHKRAEFLHKQLEGLQLKI